MEGALGRWTEAAKAEMGRDMSSPQASTSPPRFTPLELAAAEQLIHLSESSSSGGGAAFTRRWGGMRVPSAASASSSFSSSPRSVNNATPARGVGDVEDEDEQEVGGRRRRNRRIRSIAEIYAASAPIGSRGGGKDSEAGARE
ncbi:hypothetical protein ABZP36_025343 [Zizania latifolia]